MSKDVTLNAEGGFRINSHSSSLFLRKPNVFKFYLDLVLQLSFAQKMPGRDSRESGKRALEEWELQVCLGLPPVAFHLPSPILVNDNSLIKQTTSLYFCFRAKRMFLTHQSCTSNRRVVFQDKLRPQCL